jgi:hypothetical protein
LDLRQVSVCGSGNDGAKYAIIGGRRGVTYSDCGEDILQLVDECNQPRVVYVDPIGRISFPRGEGLLGMCLRIRVCRHGGRWWR